MKNIKKGILNCMKRYIFLSSIILIFIIFGIKLGIILSNSSNYEKKLEEKINRWEYLEEINQKIILYKENKNYE